MSLKSIVTVPVGSSPTRPIIAASSPTRQDARNTASRKVNGATGTGRVPVSASKLIDSQFAFGRPCDGPETPATGQARTSGCPCLVLGGGLQYGQCETRTGNLRGICLRIGKSFTHTESAIRR